VVATASYDPYGNPLGGQDSGYGYTGEPWLAELGLLHLRARWYDPNTATFLSRDSMESEPPYQYVRGNPINMTDPTGMYGETVHYFLTRSIAWDVFESLGWSEDETFYLSLKIARADQHVDEGQILEPKKCLECHFLTWDLISERINTVMSSNNAYLLGAVLHQYQDWFTHWNEGYNSSHFEHYMTAYGQFPVVPSRDQAPEKAAIFFNGYHDELLLSGPRGPETVIVDIPAHERNAVIANILQRNPQVVINQLSDWDLIDLYLRHDGLNQTDPDADLNLQPVPIDGRLTLNYFRYGEELFDERTQYSFDSDSYIRGSTRDSVMAFSTKATISRWLVPKKPCDIDWSEPSDEIVKNFLVTGQLPPDK
jgi:RHS repeat-associated protein